MGTDDPSFFFCMGSHPSKLIVKNENPSNSSELIVSSKAKDGINNFSKTLWEIVPNWFWQKKDNIGKTQ